MGCGSHNFQTYHHALQRLHFAEMIDEHREAQIKRRLSLVGPSYTQEQWLQIHQERRRQAEDLKASAGSK